MSPPTTPTYEAQAPSSKLQAEEMGSFYAALDEDQRQVVDKTMEHTNGGWEPSVGDPATPGVTTGADHGETDSQRHDGAGNPRVLQVVRGGDAATAAADVSDSADSVGRTGVHYAENEPPTEDLLAQMRSLRTTIEDRIIDISAAMGRGRSTVRSGSQRGSSNFFIRLEQCKQLLEQAQDADVKLTAKLSGSCATAHDGGGISRHIDEGIWASSRGDMGKFQATVRASAEDGLRFYRTLGTMTTMLAEEIDFGTRPNGNDVIDGNDASNGGSKRKEVGDSGRSGRLTTASNMQDTQQGGTTASGEKTAPERRTTFDQRTAQGLCGTN